MNVTVWWILSIIIFGVLYLALKFLKAKQVAKENKMMEAYMQSLEIFCEKIKRRVEATRRYRHDLKSYIQMLEALLEANSQNSIIRQYVEEQREKHLELKQAQVCSDDFINTILCVKQEECRRKEIDLRVHIVDEDYSGIDAMDRICLFVNLLDNAIEETERLPHKDEFPISIHVEVADNQMLISMENGLEKNKEFSFHTKKADKDNHGIGTRIIQQVLEKYNGTRNIVIDYKHHLVKDKISLTLKREEEAVCVN